MGELAGENAPGFEASIREPLIVDLDATLVCSHSDKEGATGNYKRGYGFHPLCAFADHGTEGAGEPLEIMLRPGRAGSNTAEDHIKVARAALRQLPVRKSKKILIRTDTAGCTHDFIDWLDGKVQYSVGFELPAGFPEIYAMLPEQAWTPALDSDEEPRNGADVAEITCLLKLAEHGWPDTMRVIVRRERPHPGAQLGFDDVDGFRCTAFATNTRAGQHQQLELRHRRRARCEDRIRTAKDTGLAKMPLHGFGQNRIWCLIVQLASELIAWTQMLALDTCPARKWKPKTLRARLFNCPAETVRTSRTTWIRYKQTHPWATLLAQAITRLARLPAPG